jgi:hypothetical protein
MPFDGGRRVFRNYFDGGVSDLDLIARNQYLLGDLLIIDERTVSAFHVRKYVGISFVHNFGMNPGRFSITDG